MSRQRRSKGLLLGLVLKESRKDSSVFYFFSRYGYEFHWLWWCFVFHWEDLNMMDRAFIPGFL